MKRFNLLLAAGIFLILGSMLYGAVPKLINFQGILKDGSGNPVTNGSYSVAFTIYNAPTGGINLWSETQSVNTTNGLFTVLLGSTSPVPDSAFKDTSRYLGIAVSPDPEMTPRQQLVSVGYGYRVSSVDAATGGTIFGDVSIQSDLTVSGKATIGPGHTNTGTNAFVAGENNTASGEFATVGGGFSNTASGLRATVGGGSSNTASGDSSTVSGGRQNTASGQSSTVSGGLRDTASGQVSTVCGGNRTIAIGQFASVGGGQLNVASGNFSTLGGGQNNIASGFGATVPGGRRNTALGSLSLAAGFQAKANHDGTFVWADASGIDFASSGANQFLIRASGGVGIGTNSPTKMLEVAGSIKVGANDTIFSSNLSSNSPLRLQTIGTTRMYIDDVSGNVGIGTTSPGVIVETKTGINQYSYSHTNGTIQLATFLNGTFNSGMIGTVSNHPFQIYTSNSGPVMTLTTGGTAGNVGIGTAAPTQKLHVVGNICATGTIGACSDVRFKKSVQPLEGALDKVERLRGVSYQWNREKYPEFAEGKQIGFVAQEVREVLPEVVSEGSDGTLSVDYGRMTAVLLEAMKAQQTQIEELQKTIKELKEEK